MPAKGFEWIVIQMEGIVFRQFDGQGFLRADIPCQFSPVAKGKKNANTE